MPTIINLNLLLAACEYSSVAAERKTNPKSEMTYLIYVTGANESILWKDGQYIVKGKGRKWIYIAPLL